MNETGERMLAESGVSRLLEVVGVEGSVMLSWPSSFSGLRVTSPARDAPGE